MGPKCSVQIEVASKEQRVKICTPKMEKICPEKPCPTCPIFCQPLNQVWCEDDFKVMERETREKICQPSSTSDPAFCSVVEKRVDLVSSGRRCYEKVLQPLCATIDCKFDAQHEECAQTTRPLNITLKTEICKSCQLATWQDASASSSSELCTSQVDGRPCATGFKGKWVKKCQVFFMLAAATVRKAPTRHAPPM